MQKVAIKFNEMAVEATIYDTLTGIKIIEALPLTGNANVWGKEIYFSIDVEVEQEANAREELEIGDLGFWPVGNAFCIFFGPTPVSRNGNPRAYSPVNIFGKIESNVAMHEKVMQGDKITIELL